MTLFAARLNATAWSLRGLLIWGLLSSMAAQTHAEVEFFVNPSLPCEENSLELIWRTTDQDIDAMLRLEVFDAAGELVIAEEATPSIVDGKGEGNWQWTPSCNGVYRATVTQPDGTTTSIAVPVLSKSRQIDLIWYRPFPGMRWATAVSHALQERGEVKDLQERGIKALRSKSGSTTNYAKRKDLPPDQVLAAATEHYSIPEGFVHDGYGIDEFGAYRQTSKYDFGISWLQGLVDATQKHDDDVFIAAWHCGPVDDQWLGLYRHAADVLLVEAYEMHYVPVQLGTENIYQDLLVRADQLRINNLFTRVYRSRCKALIALEVGGRKGVYDNPAEMEQLFRFIRREIPEMRGIGLFNGSCATEANARIVEELCLEYFIKPVVTLQEGNLWLKESEGAITVVAAVSNIGAIDSGPVTIQISANGVILGEKQIDTTPAGYSRLSNRAFVEVPFQATESGIQTFQAEILAAPSSTVLVPRMQMRRFITSEN